jgi:SagB-type dehydrogenase family enzyme
MESILRDKEFANAAAMPERRIENKPALQLAPQFALIPTEDGVIIDGGRQTEMLTGPLAVTLLPMLLPFLKDSHTQEEIRIALPQVPETELTGLLQHLMDWKVLQPPSTPAEQQSNQHTLAAIRRHTLTYDLDKAAQLLSDLDIVLFYDHADHDSVERISDAMSTNGWHHVRTVDVQSVSQFPFGESSHVIYLSEGVENAAFQSSSLLTWTRTVFDPERGLAEIGPTFYPDTVLCRNCLNRPVVGRLTESPIVAADRRIWEAVVATEITAQLLGVTSIGPGAVRRYHLPTFESELRTWHPAKLCPYALEHEKARRLGQAATLTNAVPLLYEFDMFRRHDAADALTHVFTARPALRKQLLDNEVHRLDRLTPAFPHSLRRLLSVEALDGHSEVHLSAVTALVQFAFGLHQPSKKSPKRWAPSAGNLGSAEAYLVVNKIEGLTPGVYWYRPEDHVLNRLNDRQCDHLHLAGAAIKGAKGADAALVMVGAYRTLSPKYHAFAYKLTHLDAGSTASQLYLVAKSVGVSLSPSMGWDAEKLETALSLRRSQEFVTHVFLLGTPHSGSNSAGRMHYTCSQDSLWNTEELESLSAEQKIDHMIRHQEPTCGYLSTASLEHPGKWKIWSQCAGTIGDKGESLNHFLETRRSTRFFQARPVHRKIIQLVLETAFRDVSSSFSTLQLNVIVRNAVGIAAGIYVYTPAAKTLTRSQRDVTDTVLRRGFLNSPYEQSPLTFWISASIAMSAERLASSYHGLLQQAGFLAHRICVSAAYYSLSGAPIAGISSEGTAIHDEWLDGGQTSMIAFICGYPAADHYTEEPA